MNFQQVVRESQTDSLTKLHASLTGFLAGKGVLGAAIAEDASWTALIRRNRAVVAAELRRRHYLKEHQS